MTFHVIPAFFKGIEVRVACPSLQVNAERITARYFIFRTLPFHSTNTSSNYSVVDNQYECFLNLGNNALMIETIAWIELHLVTESL
jgi:hypothetical protein